MLNNRLFFLFFYHKWTGGAVLRKPERLRGGKKSLWTQTTAFTTEKSNAEMKMLHRALFFRGKKKSRKDESMMVHKHCLHHTHTHTQTHKKQPRFSSVTGSYTFITECSVIYFILIMKEQLNITSGSSYSVPFISDNRIHYIYSVNKTHHMQYLV